MSSAGEKTMQVRPDSPTRSWALGPTESQSGTAYARQGDARSPCDMSNEEMEAYGGMEGGRVISDDGEILSESPHRISRSENRATATVTVERPSTSATDSTINTWLAASLNGKIDTRDISSVVRPPYVRHEGLSSRKETPHSPRETATVEKWSRQGTHVSRDENRIF